MGSNSKNKATTMDPMAAHVVLGPSNEELLEGQAQAEKLRAESGFPKVEFGTDAHDKQVDGFGDLEFDPYGVTDPLEGIKRAYGREGFALKALSDTCNNRLGKRGYQIVKDPNGDPVRFGTMVIGEIPEEIAKKRRALPIIESNRQLRNIKDSHREEVDRLKNDAKGMGLTVLEAGDTVNNIGDGNDYRMGISVDRGEQT